LDNYIIRIYRRGDNPAEELVGTIERAGGGEQESFRNFEELRKILSNRKARRGGSSRLQARRKGP
jgi:hypothetical protein